MSTKKDPSAPAVFPTRKAALEAAEPLGWAPNAGEHPHENVARLGERRWVVRKLDVPTGMWRVMTWRGCTAMLTEAACRQLGAAAPRHQAQTAAKKQLGVASILNVTAVRNAEDGDIIAVVSFKGYLGFVSHKYAAVTLSDGKDAATDAEMTGTLIDYCRKLALPLAQRYVDARDKAK